MRALPERHLPVAVEAAGRVDGDRQRADVAALAPAVAEEVAERHFDGRRLLVVPVDAQDQSTPPGGVDRQPDVLDRARPVDLGERDGLVRRDVDAGRDLPALTELAGGIGAGAFGRHAAGALLAGGVLRADRARLRVGEPAEIPEMRAESVEAVHRCSLPFGIAARLPFAGVRVRRCSPQRDPDTWQSHARVGEEMDYGMAGSPGDRL